MKANKKNKVFTRFSFFLLGFFLFLFPVVSSAPSYSPVDAPMPIFLIIGIGSLIFLGLGIFAKSSLLAIIGLIGILVCGFLMMQGHILIPDGYNETVDGATTIVTPIYENWSEGNNELFGFFIIIASAGLLWIMPSEYAED